MTIQRDNLRQIISCGVTPDDARALRRISMTLRRWYLDECNGAIQRGGDDGEGHPFWYNTHTARKISPAPDR